MTADLIYRFVLQDIKQRVQGSSFGFFWLLAKPVLTIVVMWLVFSYGLRTDVSEHDNFNAWLSLGVLLWIFTFEVLSSLMNSFKDFSYLFSQAAVKPIYIPIVRLISTVTIYLPVFILLLFYLLSTGYDARNFLIFVLVISFYCMFLFLVGASIGLIRLYINDLIEIFGSVMQVGFWLTPVIWSSDLLPSEYSWFVILNPFAMPIEVLRASLGGYSLSLLVGSNFLVFYCYLILSAIIFLWMYLKLRGRIVEYV